MGPGKGLRQFGSIALSLYRATGYDHQPEAAVISLYRATGYDYLITFVRLSRNELSELGGIRKMMVRGGSNRDTRYPTRSDNDNKRKRSCPEHADETQW
jgi:hypothetical protein